MAWFFLIKEILLLSEQGWKDEGEFEDDCRSLSFRFGLLEIRLGLLDLFGLISFSTFSIFGGFLLAEFGFYFFG